MPTPSPTPAAAPKRPNLLRRLYAWVLGWAETPYGTPALFVISFAESSFFPIPPDVLQIALSVSKPRRALFYAAVSCIASVLGGILGWYIGHALWGAIGDWFFAHVPGFTRETFALVESKYQENAFFAIFTAAFTPIPYKVITILAGVCAINFPMFVLASAIGRSARFYLVAWLFRTYGPPIKDFIERRFAIVTSAIAVVGILGFVVLKYAL